MISKIDIMAATWGKIDFLELENLPALVERKTKIVGGVEGSTILISEDAKDCILRHVQQYVDACSFEDVHFSDFDACVAEFSRFIQQAVRTFAGEEAILIFAAANQNRELFEKALSSLPCFVTEGF